MNTADLSARSVRKSLVPIADLGALRWWSWVALIAAVAVAAGHRWALGVAEQSRMGIFTNVALGALRFANAPTWVPLAAAVIALELLGLAFLTGGFRHGRRSQLIVLTVANVSAMILALPLVIAIAAGALVIILMIAAVALVIALVILVIGALLLAA